MVKRCIGIDIGSSYLRAVQIARTAEQFCVEKIFGAKTRRSKDSPQEILRHLPGEHGFDHRADVAIAMPNDAVFYRNLETDIASLEQIRQAPKSALEHNIPIEPDEIVAQVCPQRRLLNEKCSVLTAAVSRTSLRERLNILAAAKMHPNLVETVIFAIHSTVVVNHPEVVTGRAIIAYIDDSYLALAVTEDNNIVIVRNIPIASQSDNNTDLNPEKVAQILNQEAEVTWLKAFGEEPGKDMLIYLATAGDISPDIEKAIAENARFEIVIVEPYAMVKHSFEKNGDAGIAVAEGLALRALAPEKTVGVNFLEADNAGTKPTLNLKKELIMCAALAAAIVVVSFAGLFVQLFRLESKYKNIKNETEEVFRRTLPEEKNIVDPLVQMEQKLASFRKDYQLFASFYPANLSPLKVLHGITSNIPSQGNIRIDDLLITAESVRLKGTCDSFDSVYRWQRLLQDIPGFTLVDVQDVQKDAGANVIHFIILITLDSLPAIQEQK
jgi:type II secretory pathway component PulL